jgi:hypothetical protein
MSPRLLKSTRLLIYFPFGDCVSMNPTHIGDEIIENADYFQISKIWLPHQIRQYINGKIRMEEEQTGSLLEAPIDLMTLAPPNPKYFTSANSSAPPSASPCRSPPIPVAAHGMTLRFTSSSGPMAAFTNPLFFRAAAPTSRNKPFVSCNPGNSPRPPVKIGRSPIPPI